MREGKSTTGTNHCIKLRTNLGYLLTNAGLGQLKAAEKAKAVACWCAAPDSESSTAAVKLHRGNAEPRQNSLPNTHLGSVSYWLSPQHCLTSCTRAGGVSWWLLNLGKPWARRFSQLLQEASLVLQKKTTNTEQCGDKNHSLRKLQKDLSPFLKSSLPVGKTHNKKGLRPLQHQYRSRRGC